MNRKTASHVPQEQEFRIACHGISDGVEVMTKRGVIVGHFGIDEREPGKWVLTHLRTGQNLSKMAAPSLGDAIAAATLLNSRPEIWRHGQFGVLYDASRSKWIQQMRALAASEIGEAVKRLLPARLSE